MKKYLVITNRTAIHNGLVSHSRLWMGYTHTTTRHINGALAMLGASQKITKKEWGSIAYKESVVVE